ncbi:hypothetical protein QC762_707220 [Podospora pseudocomata]|uniref:PHD and RING finger domain-containing protein n=1 Tax=Podospora pseudocomata TaxID=2093779 RepID=A0ABR0G3V3_9PEZI|nr:hypothetical protein QC762_707220 [Podospora pseudocomata]
MADQCIVCLENLEVESNPDATTPAQQRLSKELEAEHARLAVTDPNALAELNSKQDLPLGGREHHVAQIPICGHMLHDVCLREWSEKANSCPICRQTFHVVTVYDRIGGQYLSTRRVEDKKQVPEFDPQAWADENPEEEVVVSNPCPVCNSADHEEVLLLCDGCDACYHTHCIGLDRIPAGPWFCMECVHSLGPELIQPAAAGNGLQENSARPLYYFPRTQASMRRARQRARSDEWQGAWGRITGRIWDALELDLDYQDDDDQVVFEGLRRSQQLRERERQEHERWQQRLNIASRLGARDVFVNNMPILARPAPPPPPPQESREETLAWGALEKARETTESRKRKSRSGTAEPHEEQHPEPERKLKRPRTRRMPTIQNGESSTAARAEAEPSNRPEQSNGTSSANPGAASRTTTDIPPSFLSSLLKEVEMSTPSDEETLRHIYGPIPGANDVSSPARSPSPLSQGCITPPPVRSSSPHMTLSSHITPIYPPANFSPTRASSSNSSSIKPSRATSPHKHAHRDNRSSPENSDSEPRGRQHPRPLELRQPQPRRNRPAVLPRSENVSPTRPTLPLELKQNINSIVKAALRPHWRDRQLTAEQYEKINRDISRLIYEEVKDPSAVTEDTKQSWEKTASQEVARAVASLKA